MKKGVDNALGLMYNESCVEWDDAQFNIGRGINSVPKEKYSRGWRGAPAKGVGQVTGARVQIPSSPFHLFSK